ncbi:MAG TPA: DNA ligase, partial [Planctomycetes bacterium]|nr:DNA ligase [Planctomycetota bacterium]
AAKKPAAKPKAKAAASGAGELAEDEPRRFELVSGSSNKFWEITLSGTGFTVRYGKIGSDGRSQTKDFKSGDEARQVALELIGQKTKKGYVEC